jgi:hypothetical protein
MRMRTLAVLAIMAFGLAGSATAQSSSGAVERSGFLIGFALGGGQLTCDGCDSRTGPAVDIHLGSMMGEKAALMFDGSGINVSDEHDNTSTSVVDTFAIQYWVADRIWVKGGVGIGALTCDGCDTETGLGFMGAAGVELLQKGKFALDVQGRFATAKYDEGRINQLTFMVGANWY